ncbi:MAG: ribosomal-protein-alanine N-acetyltransferase [Deltaproteobacteria bacterium]|nr:ribosomal-protein-alanine N-acetyltransferase [Deltaproteobacteria bacterium]
MIRLATTTDASAVGTLIIETIQGTTKSGSAWVSEQIDSPTGVVLVDEELQQIRGFIVGQIVIDEAEIHDLGVAETSRRNGIGSKLIKAFEAHVIHQGAVTCVLEVRASNNAAREAYAKAGYTVIAQRDRYYSDGEHALLMRHDFKGSS